MATTDTRQALAAMKTRLDQDAHDRDVLIARAAQDGVPKTELADLTGLSRSTIYEIIAKQDKLAEEEAAKNAESELARVLSMWERGKVIEDRWGLRWRADSMLSRPPQDGWQCRSVGLKIWRTSVQMAERGPFKEIRVDRVFTGDDAKAARIAGQTADEAVTVPPVEDPEDEVQTLDAAHRSPSAS